MTVNLPLDSNHLTLNALIMVFAFAPIVALFLAPGIQYVTRRYILEAAVQIPVVQNLNGNGLENDDVTVH